MKLHFLIFAIIALLLPACNQQKRTNNTIPQQDSTAVSVQEEPKPKASTGDRTINDYLSFMTAFVDSLNNKQFNINNYKIQSEFLCQSYFNDSTNSELYYITTLKNHYVVGYVKFDIKDNTLTFSDSLYNVYNTDEFRKWGKSDGDYEYIKNIRIAKRLGGEPMIVYNERYSDAGALYVFDNYFDIKSNNTVLVHYITEDSDGDTGSSTINSTIEFLPKVHNNFFDALIYREGKRKEKDYATGEGDEYEINDTTYYYFNVKENKYKADY